MEPPPHLQILFADITSAINLHGRMAFSALNFERVILLPAYGVPTQETCTSEVHASRAFFGAGSAKVPAREKASLHHQKWRVAVIWRSRNPKKEVVVVKSRPNVRITKSPRKSWFAVAPRKSNLIVFSLKDFPRRRKHKETPTAQPIKCEGTL